jgi:hypothetical protein
VNYFTSERLVKLQDRSNERNFLAALDDWERALDEYRRRLRRLRGELPNDLQLLLDTRSLHDSRVLDMWWGGRTQFTITLQQDSETARLVVLTYSLTEPPHVSEDVLPESVRSEPVAWLYDELDVPSRKNRRAFIHRILLSDGREVHLHFRNVTVKRPLSVVPAHTRIR